MDLIKGHASEKKYKLSHLKLYRQKWRTYPDYY
uniref:Uncharacterized protein n=1 Tax=Siphoviridae sp. ctuOq1 TaxID=2825713 RepID=A0A8S5UZ52_9CAUD|nr:MAG TPA: hypothetical protein [Siphoviridae sp. ctuOq1]